MRRLFIFHFVFLPFIVAFAPSRPRRHCDTRNHANSAAICISPSSRATALLPSPPRRWIPTTTLTTTLTTLYANPWDEMDSLIPKLFDVPGLMTTPAQPDSVALEAASHAALSSLGHDLLTFLAASVAVVPISQILGITPVLGFLAAGLLLGPHALGVFDNSEADLLLGDFGILFLLFSEGLNLSPKKISELESFSKLGVLQMLATMTLFFSGLIMGGPLILQYVAPVMHMEADIMHMFTSPVQAFCVASAGALSSSAFVLPVLKEKKWEDRPEGVAALSVLLLQDLAVAPLLVILPLIAGSGPQSGAELGILAAKATIGFGAVLAIGSVLLRYVFDVVAAARSTETFVAAALIVALGMGQAADYLGLSATTGAFAAGVLLAGNRYRAQIKADIRPFEGILLGIFFLTAGASLDPQVVIDDFSTLVAGILVFIVIKAAVLFVAGPAIGKSRAQAARVAITLAGGGEFSLVLFKLAQDLDVLPDKLFKLLSASVILSMSLTPLLGSLADVAGNYLESREVVLDDGPITAQEAQNLFDEIDTDKNGTIDFDELRAALVERGLSYASIAEVFVAFDTDADGVICRDEWRDGLKKGLLAAALRAGMDADVNRESAIKIAENPIIICGYTEFGKELYGILEAAGLTTGGGVVGFDLNPSRVEAGLQSGANVLYGDSSSPGVLLAAGIKAPKAVIVAYRSEKRRVDATSRLRAFLPEGTPIFARVISGQTVGRDELLEAGATDVVSERTEAALQFATLVGALEVDKATEQMRNRIAAFIPTEFPVLSEATSIPGIPEDRLNDLAEEFDCTRSELEKLHDSFSSLPNFGDDKFISVKELRDLLLRTDDFPLDDAAVANWMKFADSESSGKLSFVDFARAYFGAKMSSTAVEN